MQILLMLHISGALVTAIVVFLSFIIKPYQKAIIGCGIFQILSGTFLFALQPSSIAQFCAKIGIYIFLITAPLTYFYWKDKQKQKAFSQ